MDVVEGEVQRCGCEGNGGIDRDGKKVGNVWDVFCLMKCNSYAPINVFCSSVRVDLVRA